MSRNCLSLSLCVTGADSSLRSGELGHSSRSGCESVVHSCTPSYPWCNFPCGEAPLLITYWNGDSPPRASLKAYRGGSMTSRQWLLTGPCTARSLRKAFRAVFGPQDQIRSKTPVSNNGHLMRVPLSELGGRICSVPLRLEFYIWFSFGAYT